MLTAKQQQTVRRLLGFLELMVAACALPTGWLLFQDPTGAALGLDTAALRGSEFTDFFVPGLVLMLFHGLGMLGGAVASFAGWKHAGHLALVLGAGLVLAVLIQISSMGLVSFLPPIFLGTGMVIFGMGWWIRRFKAAEQAPAGRPFF